MKPGVGIQRTPLILLPHSPRSLRSALPRLVHARKVPADPGRTAAHGRVIHELWMGNDASLLIMPGLSLNVPSVRDELTRHLPENWNSIVDREVDGRNPYLTLRISLALTSAGTAAEVARTIMLGSAPTERSQAVRDRSIPDSPRRSSAWENIPFNDALNTLRNELSYLYSNPSGDDTGTTTVPRSEDSGGPSPRS